AFLRDRRPADAADPGRSRAQAARGEAAGRTPRGIRVEPGGSVQRTERRRPRAPRSARRSRGARSAAGGDRGAPVFRRAHGRRSLPDEGAVARDRAAGPRERAVLARPPHAGRVMDARTWATAKALLADAAERPAAEQAAFIEARCPDVVLRAELLAMLAAPAPLSD